MALDSAAIRFGNSPKPKKGKRTFSDHVSFGEISGEKCGSAVGVKRVSALHEQPDCRGLAFVRISVRSDAGKFRVDEVLRCLAAQVENGSGK